MGKSKDDEIVKLKNLIDVKKNEINDVKPIKWLTNKSFKLPTDVNKIANLNTISSVNVVAQLLSELITINSSFLKSVEILGVSDTPFLWFGYSYDEWENDFKNVVRLITIKKEKEDLKNMEKFLENKLSQDYKDELEFAEIRKKLGL